MPSRQASGTVVSRIEAVLESVLENLARHEPASIELASKRTEDNISETIQFPGTTHAEARKFGGFCFRRFLESVVEFLVARVLLILQIVHDALVSGTVLTKRNIFYQNQDLFGNQTQVNSLVDAVALTLSASREDLNIVATSKGLVAGRSSVRLTDGTIVDLALGDTGTAIPSPGSIDTFYFDHIRWVLVVEKDAVFRSLCAKRYWDNAIIGPGLVLTAKGYPDLVTREFLQVIHKKASHLPILTLADYDVDGLNIVKSYRYSVDPTSRHTSTLNPGVQWLGITSNQLLRIENEVPPRPLPSQQALEISEPSPVKILSVRSRNETERSRWAY
ncbi:type IIB DNA topoisomerase domain-containing protein [Sarocladium implicatum]|nr:type IIB DNA topoisomerase domain-containing protein [Sarocladium implicatum]